MRRYIRKETLQEIESKLELISGEVERHYKENQLGLLDGNAGLAMYLFHYADYFQNQKYHDLATDILEEIVDKIDTQKIMESYCSGIIGIAWAIDHVCKAGFIENDSNVLLCSIDEFAIECMETKVKSNDLDFIHGSVGDAWYLLQRMNSKNEQAITAAFAVFLEVLAKNKPFPIDADNNRKDYNLGLAHGLPALIVLLSKMAAIDSLQEKVIPILSGYCSFLLKCKLEGVSCNCVFPATISVYDNSVYTPSRLAWCYGDLGIALSLHIANEVLEDVNIEKSVAYTIGHSAKRINNKHDDYELVIDPMFCHGSIGISHLFNRLYQYTDIEASKHAALYWLKETLQFNKQPGAIDGFKSFNSSKNTFEENFTLLNGLPGIGLGLLSLISAKELKWDQCLMIS